MRGPHIPGGTLLSRSGPPTAKTPPQKPPRQTARDARHNEREPQEETNKVAIRGQLERLDGVIKFTRDDRPSGAGAVDLVGK